MADDKKSPEEYEYPPEEYYKGGEYIPPDDRSQPFGVTGKVSATSRSRPMFLVMSILIAVGIVYFILLYVNSRKSAELSQPVGVTAAYSPPKVSTTVKQATPQHTAVTSGLRLEPGPSDEALRQAHQQNQANQQAMANLQNQIQQLQAQLSEVTRSIATLGSQIQIIASEIKAIEVDRSLKGQSLKREGRGAVYHLKALVPGRAWLEATDGTSISVAIGDRLPSYGIVQMINTDQGIVTTSSGGIIQYGAKDS